MNWLSLPNNFKGRKHFLTK